MTRLSAYSIRFPVHSQPRRYSLTALQPRCSSPTALQPRRSSRTAWQHPRPEAPTHEGDLSGRSLMKKVLLRRVGVPLPAPSAACASCCPLLPLSRAFLSVVSSSAGSGWGINACTCTNTPSCEPNCQAGCLQVCGTPRTQRPAVSRASEIRPNSANWQLFWQDRGGEIHTVLQLWKRSRPLLRITVESSQLRTPPYLWEGHCSLRGHQCRNRCLQVLRLLPHLPNKHAQHVWSIKGAAGPHLELFHAWV